MMVLLRKGLLGFCCILGVYGLSAQTIKTVDIVKVNGSYDKEAMYFYDENWKAFRQEALKKRVISGYEILRTETDSAGYYHLILITHYGDSTHFREMEKNFAPIMKSISPNGPRMLNEVPRKDFLQYISGFEGLSIVSAGRKRR